MLTEERHRKILALLSARKTVAVQELTELFQASESTIRRDLAALGRMGRLVKVHGGAMALEDGYQGRDVSVSQRMEENKEEKERIAAFAAALIADGDFVYIDAGSTTLLLVEQIPEGLLCEFVTNGLPHGRRLAERGFSVSLLGGRIKPETEAVVGCDAVDGIRKYHFTKGFFGTNGIHKHAQYSTPDAEEARVKQEAAAHCQTAYVLADRTKFFCAAPVTFAALSACKLITSRAPDAAWKKEIETMEVEQDD